MQPSSISGMISSPILNVSLVNPKMTVQKYFKTRAFKSIHTLQTSPYFWTLNNFRYLKTLKVAKTRLYKPKKIQFKPGMSKIIARTHQTLRKLAFEIQLKQVQKLMKCCKNLIYFDPTIREAANDQCLTYCFPFSTINATQPFVIDL